MVAVTHGGLSGRHIGAANSARFVAPGRPTGEDEISATIRVSITELEKRLPELVKELMTPLFMVFDFFDPDQTVWEELVRKFEGAEVG